MNYRRLLIFTDGFLNDGTGSGVTLYNLFKGWDKNKLSVFSAAYDKSNNGLLFPNRCFEGNLNQAKVAKKDKNFSLKILIKNIFNASWLRPYLTPIAPVRISNKSLQDINTYRPEIVYAPVSDIYSIRRLLKLLSLNKDIKVYTVFFDDLIDRYDSVNFSYIYKRVHFFYLKKIISISQKTFVCSEAMRTEYEQIFNAEFHVVSNPVDLNLVKKYRVKKINNLNFNVVYAGTVNSKNINNLKLMSATIKKLNEDGIKINFDLYTFGTKLDLVKKSISSNHNNTRIFKAPNDDHDLFKILGNANILYLPMDFSQESIKSIRLSYLTKQPLYMSIGVPMIVHGPEEIHVVRHAKENNYAEVISINSFEHIYNSVKNHFYNYDSFLTSTQNGIKYATEKHNIILVQKWFYKNLLS